MAFSREPLNGKCTRWTATTLLVGLLILAPPLSSIGAPQGTAFTYQGQLTNNGTPANGLYDLFIQLYDDELAGSLLGLYDCQTVMVVNGLFTARLDFGEQFQGNAVWMQIRVRPHVDGSPCEIVSSIPYQVLSPRRRIDPSPYSVNSDSLDGSELIYLMRKADYDFDTDGRVDSGAMGSTLSAADNTPAIAQSITPDGTAIIGADGTYEGGTFVSEVEAFAKQLVLGGPFNLAPNTGDSVKLLIADYDNDNATSPIYPVYVEDENNNVDFYLRKLGQACTGYFGGRLGIGTTTPDRPLHVAGGARVGRQGLAFGDQAEAAIQFRTDIGGVGVTLAGESISVQYASAADAYHSNTGIWQSFTAVGSGNVAAIEVLRADVTGSGTASSNSVELYEGTGTGGNLLARSTNPLPPPTSGLQWQRAYFGTNISLASGNSYTIFLPFEGTSINWWGDILGSYPGGSGSGPYDSCFRVFYTSGQTEIVSMTPAGRMGVGRVPAANRFEVEGQASKSAAGGFVANSDARIKEDIHTVTNGLDTIRQVRPVTFRYTEAYRAAHPSLAAHLYHNVIAQEFAEVFPDYVQASGDKLPGSDEQILQVDTHPLTITSVAAIQELDGLVQELIRENGELKARLADIEQQLKTMNSPVAASN